MKCNNCDGRGTHPGGLHCGLCGGCGFVEYSKFVIEWARKFEEAFPLSMGEAEMTKDFSTRKLEYSVDLLGFIEDLIEDFNLRRRKA